MYCFVVYTFNEAACWNVNALHVSVEHLLAQKGNQSRARNPLANDSHRLSCGAATKRKKSTNTSPWGSPLPTPTPAPHTSLPQHRYVRRLSGLVRALLPGSPNESPHYVYVGTTSSVWQTNDTYIYHFAALTPKDSRRKSLAAPRC